MLRSIALLCCISIMILPLFAQNSAQKLDELMRAYMKRGEFKGSVLVSKEGRVLLEKGYGDNNTVATIYQIASVTKTFTAALVLKLAELQQLSLQDRLSKYYPDYPHGDSITIEHLLTHTSGIYNYTRDPDFMDDKKTMTEQEILTWLKKKPLDFTPGSQHQYSNSGYVLLGYIIQQLTGLSYQQAIRHYIFDPLKMSHSGFDFVHLSAKEKATGYYADSTKDYNQPAPVADSSVPFAAGSIYSTVEDLYRWHNGLQDHAIVNAAMLERAYTPCLQNYGYGWIIDSCFRRRVVSHSGGMWGFRSNFARVTSDNTCIILLSNTETPALESITRKILAILYDQAYELPTVKQAVHLSDSLLMKYAGDYKIDEKQLIIHISLENGFLVARPENGPVSVMVPENETRFFLREEQDFEVTFVTDEKSRVTGLSINSNGRKGIARRLH